MSEIVRAQWAGIPGHFPNVELDSYVIMPNHMHGIVIINESRRGEVTSPPKDKSSTGDETSPLRNATLGRVIGYFKYQATKLINQKMGAPGRKVFQRNYYEHIIRNNADLHRIRTYIANNPLQWVIDEENPNNRTK